jgi:hypothetical protein
LAVVVHLFLQIIPGLAVAILNCLLFVPQAEVEKLLLVGQVEEAVAREISEVTLQLKDVLGVQVVVLMVPTLQLIQQVGEQVVQAKMV